MLNISEQPSRFKSPEEEIESLKRRIDELKTPSPEENPEAVIETVKEHTKKIPGETLTEEYIYTPSKEDLSGHNSVIFDLPPEEHDQKILKLLKLAEEKGIINVVNLILRTDDAHLLDDFERALARKLTKNSN